ncbi:DUF2752 domain-containing protein [Iamia majanohamensis]|uniref:DUF2752 domain-containing protein n=1 Tax=Iamia majanohamensis TaxID=467976 RepID=A0AAE9YIF0_9ACTN|nr:DUF2752 domain-containing protein [Iamia majanohamensis]WCO68501.1 DUF2752 domain-containing protein [Iamia majanohamensis]
MTAVDPGPGAPAPDRAPPPPPAAPAWPTPEPGPLRRALTRRPWLAPAGVGVGVALATAYTAWQDPTTGDGLFPGCPLRSMTGWDCPGCGGLRATHALTHGDLAGALDHNVWVAVGVPLAIVVWLLWTLRTLGVPVPRLPRPRRAALGVAAVAMLVFTVVRNIPGVAAFEYLNSFT